MPYWAELWPSALALAAALPERMEAIRVVELGCGLGVPAIAAAARGAEVTALDWADEAVELLRHNAAGNAVELEAVHSDWRSFRGRYDLVLASDLLYEQRNADSLLEVLPELAPEVLIAEPGRPAAASFFAAAEVAWLVEPLRDRVYRLTRRATPGARSTHAGA